MTAVGTTLPGSLTLTFCPRMLWKAKGHWTSRTNSWKMNPLRLLKLCLALDVCEVQSTGGGTSTQVMYFISPVLGVFPDFLEKRYYIACSFGQVLFNSTAIKQFWLTKILVLKILPFLNKV